MGRDMRMESARRRGHGCERLCAVAAPAVRRRERERLQSVLGQISSSWSIVPEPQDACGLLGPVRSHCAPTADGGGPVRARRGESPRGHAAEVGDGWASRVNAIVYRRGLQRWCSPVATSLWSIGACALTDSPWALDDARFVPMLLSRGAPKSLTSDHLKSLPSVGRPQGRQESTWDRPAKGREALDLRSAGYAGAAAVVPPYARSNPPRGEPMARSAVDLTGLVVSVQRCRSSRRQRPG
jgi:hypothetical protein